MTEKGEKESVKIICENDINILVPKGEGEIKKDTQIYESLKAPFEKGKKAGEIVVYVNGEEKGRSNIVASEGCEKISLVKMIEKIMALWAV